MIRWYDWVFAVLAADLIAAMLLAPSESLATSVTQGIVIGLVYVIWVEVYMPYRQKIELDRQD